jgi:tetratricopeptide (TPR) repeat protein
MKQKAVFVAVLLLSLALVLSPAQAAKAKSKATSSDDLEALEQYVADLQKNPGNEALRIKIINLVLDMKRPPAIPEEAERFMDRGAAAIKRAKSESDFKDAVAEFQKASNAAPWLAAAYYNLGVAQEKAGQNKAAMASLKLYLLAAPNAADARKVRQRINELEFVQEKGAKGFSPDTDFKAWLARLNGSKWLVAEDGRAKVTLELNGDVITQWIYYKIDDTARIPKIVAGTKEKWGVEPLSVKLERRAFVHKTSDQEVSYEISEDGEVITSKTIWHKEFTGMIGKVDRYRRER